MKTREEIEYKVRQVTSEKLVERKKDMLSRSTCNCFFANETRLKSNGVVLLCGNPNIMSMIGAGRIFVCADSDCARCRYYKCKNTEESVEREFESIIKSPSRCGSLYPKLAVLLWVLEGGIPPFSMRPSFREKFKAFKALFQK